MLTYYCILMLTTPFLFPYSKNAISKTSFYRPCNAKCLEEVYRLAEIRVREMLEEANQAAHDITLGAN